jgi:CubicO group peptidase (beta-lactamase class C family)
MGGWSGQAHSVGRQRPAGSVDGYADPAFAAAVAYFTGLFNPTSRGGGALAVRLGGETVVDVWAGFADRSESRAWQRDTVTLAFSTTKGVAATVIHRLADRGLIEYDAPVASYWPEFAAAGKGAITVRQLLSHQAGLHSVAGLVDRPEDLLDHISLEQRLATRPTDQWPGHPGYHALTYGWLLSGLARRVTGRGMAELVTDELAVPLSTDGLGIGTPADGLRRFAPPISWAPPVRPVSPAVAALGERSMRVLREHESTRRFIDALYAPDLAQLLTGRTPQVLNTEMPSVNGLLSAHGLAKLYATIACEGEVEGVRLLSPATVRELSQVQTTARDVVVGIRMQWRLGYHRTGIGERRGVRAFGHYGYGGSGGWADPSTGLSFGFVTNDLRLIQAPVGGDTRIFRLGALVMRAGSGVAR